MKKLNRLLPLAFMAIFVLLFSAWSPAVERCHKINAKGKGAVIPGNGVETMTEADIIGGGLLNGRTRAVFTSPVSPEAFIGTLDLITKHGSISFLINDGIFVGTQFRATAVAVSSKGKLSGATGTLVLEGEIINEMGDFTEKITGEICFN